MVRTLKRDAGSSPRTRPRTWSQSRRCWKRPAGRWSSLETGEGSSMAILVDEGTRLLVQGITGREGAFHTGRMLQSGTRVVAGVTPGKGGQDYEGVPIFNTVEEAVEETGANASVIFVPPPFAADAIFEALDAGLSTICCITEGIPIHDMMRV